MTSDTDLSVPGLYAEGNPAAVWARLRAEDPVHWNSRADGLGFWALTRYRDIKAVLMDTATFSSERGMSLDGHETAGLAAAGKMLIVTDPPRHHAIRGVMHSAFTPRMVRRLEVNMRQTVAEALDPLVESGGGDFDAVASRLPVAVICDLLGIPKQDWDFMLECTRTAFGDVADPADKMMAHADLMCYYAEYLDDRRKHPGEDVVTAMLQGEVNGRPLTDEEIILNCDGLISGGNETTRHATLGAVHEFARNPVQWRLVKMGGVEPLPETVVPEILRYCSPALHVLRTATADTAIGGRDIAAGDRVTVWLPSGNRDEEVFPYGDVFDVTRARRQILTFGAGPHHCLGSRLAELELKVLFEELACRVGTIESAGPARRLRSNLIWGIESLPVHLRSSAG